MRSARWIGAVAVVVAACAPSTVGQDVAPLIDSPAGCDACITDVVACVSTSRGDAQFIQCRDLFLTCQKKAGVVDECTSPRGDDACAACDKRRSVCEKTGGDACDEDLAECVTRFGIKDVCEDAPDAPPDDEPTCEEDPSECETSGSGGSSSTSTSSGGEGGSGGGPVASCGNPCEWGAPSSPDCGACEAAVCDLDPYCCTTAWDGACITKAQGVAACGCEAPVEQCAHFECQQGDALDAACSECAQQVCAADDYCCTTAWDEACIGIASQTEVCGCSTCEHDPCAEGAALESSCSNCAGNVCAQDAYCCDNAWDATCVGIAAMKPECGCGS